MAESDKYKRMKKALERERTARKEAEKIIEQKALELYYANQQLLEINKNQESIIEERTRDIEKSKEDLIKAKKIAEEATRAKSEFLSNMTHELRTPLNGVIGLSEIVLNEKLSKNVRDMLENIKFSANHLSDVINEILDFSKIEAGKITFEDIQFNLPELIINIHKNLSQSAKKKGIDFLLDYDESIPQSLKGDPVKLNQILNNIIGNAVKFTERGFVKLTCKLINNNKKDEKVNIRFQVKDTGIGIKEDQIKNIFDSFIQSDATISRKFGGTGLGLTITKNFIELQGGTIGVDSKYGQGSIFTFILPYKQDKNAPVFAEKSNPFENKTVDAHILVVDDVMINQLVVSKILSKWECSVDIASSGKEALYLLKQKEYDLILMDVQMPEMSGLEATRIIRTDEEYRDVRKIPIIAFTANAFEESQNEIMDSGMDGFITKPVNPGKLFNEIRSIIPEKTHS